MQNFISVPESRRPLTFIEMDANGPQAVDHGPMVSHREDPAWTDSQAKQAYAYDRQPPTPGYDYQQPNHPMIQPADEKKERTICGLRVATFVLSLLLFLVIVAAAIGGGVGGTMASRRSQEETSENPSPTASDPAATTSAPSTTVSSAEPSIQPTDTSRVEVPITGLLPLNCPAMNGTTHPIVQDNARANFRVECGVDMGGVHNTVASFVAYSFENCMEACTSYNRYRNEEECVAVTFTADLDAVNRRHATCWLKNTTESRIGIPEERRRTRAIGWLL